MDHGLDRLRGEVKDARSRFEAGEGDEIAQQVEEAPSALLDQLEIPRRLLRRQRGPLLASQLGKAEDRVKRGPHFVGHAGEELAPGARRRFGPVVRGLEFPDEIESRLGQAARRSPGVGSSGTEPPTEGASAAGCDPATRKRRRNVVPRPSSLSTRISPPWARMIPNVTARPSPVPLPGGLVVKNGSKIRA